MTGRYWDPWLWGYVATVAAIGLYPTIWLDDDLAKERFSPPEPGADRRPLAAVRLIALAHVVVACLDVRWQISHVPDAVRLLGFVGMAVSIGLFFHAMMANRFFSAVIRIQKDRGHHVIDQGPYAVVRHPGYAGMVPSMAFSGLALGSWFGFAIGLSCSLADAAPGALRGRVPAREPRGISGLRGASPLPADSRGLVGARGRRNRRPSTLQPPSSMILTASG